MSTTLLQIGHLHQSLHAQVLQFEIPLRAVRRFLGALYSARSTTIITIAQPAE